MIEAQWPSDRKRPHADYVIENDGSIGQLERKAAEVWRTLLTRASAGGSR